MTCKLCSRLSRVSKGIYFAAEEQAAALKTLGLFKGVSDTDFDLDRAPTRVEALVILITQPWKGKRGSFRKLEPSIYRRASWADNYVGYAYEITDKRNVGN